MKPPDQPAAPSASASAAAERPLLLIVDDQISNITTLNAFLAADCDIGVATNGADALAFCAARGPHLLLLDVLMPGIDGFEVCRRLKADPAFRQIPVIFMTALTDTANIVAGFEAGAIDYITKPFNMPEVLARIQTHLSSQAVRRQLELQNKALNELNAKLSLRQMQLLESEKMAAVGQLAAGVAHEINNPIGFIHANLGALQQHFSQLLELLDAYQAAEALPATAARATDLCALRERLELDFLRDDIPALMAQTSEGVLRVRQIVAALRDFARADASSEWRWADLHRGIDATLSIIDHQLQSKADVVKHYGSLPEVLCLPAQINQVLLSLLSNALQALGPQRGCITIRTGADSAHAWIAISDSGSGIAPHHLARIFEPFFSTRPIGSGTGLGLSLSYGIVRKHQGHIEVQSDTGLGSTFRVVLPLLQSAPVAPGANSANPAP